MFKWFCNKCSKEMGDSKILNQSDKESKYVAEYDKIICSDCILEEIIKI